MRSYADGWHNLGTALKKIGEIELAFSALKTALQRPSRTRRARPANSSPFSAHRGMLDVSISTRNERAVQTPSRWQVRQPIYVKSIGRWRHYAEHIPALLEAFP